MTDRQQRELHDAFSGDVRELRNTTTALAVAVGKLETRLEESDKTAKEPCAEVVALKTEVKGIQGRLALVGRVVAFVVTPVVGLGAWVGWGK